MVGPNKDSITANKVNTGPQKQMVGADAGGEDDLDAMLKSLNGK